MNIVGKILVILNLVMAFVICGFVAVNYSTSSNWKKFTENFKRELDAAGQTAGMLQKTAEDLDKQVKQLRGELVTVKQNAKIATDVLEAQLKTSKSLVDDYVQKAKETDLVSQQLLGEVNRLKEESKTLAKIVEDRQTKILDMEKQAKELRDFARAKEKEAQDDHARNESMKTEILNMRLQFAKMQADPMGKRDTVPAVSVSGVIEKVDSKAGLVQISMGSDQGLKEKNILQIRRLKPRAEYLGSLQLIEVHFHKSIGRWLTPRPEGKSLQPGDQVVSSLDR